MNAAAAHASMGLGAPGTADRGFWLGYMKFLNIPW